MDKSQIRMCWGGPGPYGGAETIAEILENGQVKEECSLICYCAVKYGKKLDRWFKIRGREFFIKNRELFTSEEMETIVVSQNPTKVSFYIYNPRVIDGNTVKDCLPLAKKLEEKGVEIRW